jgi:hypothetical protein
MDRDWLEDSRQRAVNVGDTSAAGFRTVFIGRGSGDVGRHRHLAVRKPKKPLKRLNRCSRIKHRAKATVLMKLLVTRLSPRQLAN